MNENLSELFSKIVIDCFDPEIKSISLKGNKDLYFKKKFLSNFEKLILNLISV